MLISLTGPIASSDQTPHKNIMTLDLAFALELDNNRLTAIAFQWWSIPEFTRITIPFPNVPASISLEVPGPFRPPAHTIAPFGPQHLPLLTINMPTPNARDWRTTIEYHYQVETAQYRTDAVEPPIDMLTGTIRETISLRAEQLVFWQKLLTALGDPQTWLDQAQ